MPPEGIWSELSCTRKPPPPPPPPPSHMHTERHQNLPYYPPRSLSPTIPAGHAAGGDLVGALLHADLLPVIELGLGDLQGKVLLVAALRVTTTNTQRETPRPSTLSPLTLPHTCGACCRRGSGRSSPACDHHHHHHHRHKYPQRDTKTFHTIPTHSPPYLRGMPPEGIWSELSCTRKPPPPPPPPPSHMHTERHQNLPYYPPRSLSPTIPAGHAAGGDLVGALLHADLLPVIELGLGDLQGKVLLVAALRVTTTNTQRETPRPSTLSPLTLPHTCGACCRRGSGRNSPACDHHHHHHHRHTCTQRDTKTFHTIPPRSPPYLRGMLPEGIWSELSCTRTFCQSSNLDSEISRAKFFLLPHSGLGQMVG